MDSRTPHPMNIAANEANAKCRVSLTKGYRGGCYAMSYDKFIYETVYKIDCIGFSAHKVRIPRCQNLQPPQPHQQR